MPCSSISISGFWDAGTSIWFYESGFYTGVVCSRRFDVLKRVWFSKIFFWVFLGMEKIWSVARRPRESLRNAEAF